MFFATEKTINTATSVLHQLSLYQLKTFICSCAVASDHGFESYRRKFTM